VTELETERLRIRRWRDGDLTGLAALNADPRVMEHFPKVFSFADSEAMLGRARAHWAVNGFGWWGGHRPRKGRASTPASAERLACVSR